MKYFGTDGIRGVVNKDISNKLIKKVAHAIVRYFKYLNKRILLIGNDSRKSSDYIISLLQSVLLKNGIEIHNLGVCSSPCLAYTTKKFNYSLGLMISASHNPHEYNGFKFFNTNGEKVDDEFELKFEELMDKKPLKNSYLFASLYNVENLKHDYINNLKKLIKFNLPCIFDCANGSTSYICKQLFPKQEKINISPNGNNINLNAGSTHLEMLRELCIKNQKTGFAFDGDGDRVHIIDKDGSIISGDEILYILSTFFQKSGDCIVGTIYTNSTLEECLKRRNITLKRSDVGDKKVYKLMSECNSILGGEDSGHIILKQYMNTGDGVLIAIIIANILQFAKKSLKDILSGYTPTYQSRKNIKINNNFKIDDKLKSIITEYEKQGARIIIRPSGTEPVIRLFAESKNPQIITLALAQLEQFLNN